MLRDHADTSRHFQHGINFFRVAFLSFGLGSETVILSLAFYSPIQTDVDLDSTMNHINVSPAHDHDSYLRRQIPALHSIPNLSSAHNSIRQSWTSMDNYGQVVPTTVQPKSDSIDINDTSTPMRPSTPTALPPRSTVKSIVLVITVTFAVIINVRHVTGRTRTFLNQYW